MPSIKLLRAAELEFIEACEWYEKRQKGISLKFRESLRTSLNFVHLNSNLYVRKYDTDQHFAPLRKFPYIVVYWYDENLDTIFVSSIFHTKRNPKKFEFE